MLIIFRIKFAFPQTVFQVKIYKILKTFNLAIPLRGVITEF